MVFLVIFFGAMHGLFLLPVLLSLFGPGSCTSGANDDDDDDEVKPPLEKSFGHPFHLNHQKLTLNSPFGSKNYLGAPYKAYGDEKDLGIGTSGEDSSESSSSKSQRRQALEDENTRRRYEEGWRKSSFQNLDAHSLAQFQAPQPEAWSSTGSNKRRPPPPAYGYEEYFEQQRRRASFDMDREEREHYPTDERRRRKYNEEYFPDEVSTDQYQQQRYTQNRYHRRRSSDDSRNYRYQANIEERRNRRHTPPDSISRRQGPQHQYPPYLSSSQHNLYYPSRQNGSGSYYK